LFVSLQLLTDYNYHIMLLQDNNQRHFLVLSMSILQVIDLQYDMKYLQ